MVSPDEEGRGCCSAAMSIFRPTFGLGRHYRVLRLLGRGSGGSVWLARKRQTGELFALKVFCTRRARPARIRRPPLRGGGYPELAGTTGSEAPRPHSRRRHAVKAEACTDRARDSMQRRAGGEPPGHHPPARAAALPQLFGHGHAVRAHGPAAAAEPPARAAPAIPHLKPQQKDHTPRLAHPSPPPPPPPAGTAAAARCWTTSSLGKRSTRTTRATCSSSWSLRCSAATAWAWCTAT